MATRRADRTIFQKCKGHERPLGRQAEARAVVVAEKQRPEGRGHHTRGEAHRRRRAERGPCCAGILTVKDVALLTARHDRRAEGRDAAQGRLAQHGLLPVHTFVGGPRDDATFSDGDDDVWGACCHVQEVLRRAGVQLPP